MNNFASFVCRRQQLTFNELVDRANNLSRPVNTNEKENQETNVEINVASKAGAKRGVAKGTKRGPYRTKKQKNQ